MAFLGEILVDFIAYVGRYRIVIWIHDLNPLVGHTYSLTETRYNNSQIICVIYIFALRFSIVLTKL